MDDEAAIAAAAALLAATRESARAVDVVDPPVVKACKHVLLVGDGHAISAGPLTLDVSALLPPHVDRPVGMH